MRTNKSLCSLDCGAIGGQSVVFVTPFMKSNSHAFSEKLPRLYLEALDYCLTDHLFNDNENLVTFGLHFLIPREDMVSLVHPNLVRWSVVDCYCIYLNESCFHDSCGPQRFFFGARQSFAFLHVSEGSEDSSAVSDLHGIWDEWVTYENSGCVVIGADLVYFPILVDDHYVLFVIDHNNELVHYVDNIIWSDETITYFQNLTFYLCSEFADFLAQRNHPKSEKVPFYKFKLPI